MRKLFLLLAVGMAAPAQIRTVHRVDEHIYRGHQPRPGDYATLARLGVRTVLDLRGGRIHKPHERREVEAAGMQYVSVRLSGLWEPHDRQMAQVLSVLEDPARWPVYVHCRRGDDRVGMAIACYRIDHDHWTNARALAEARSSHLNPLEILMRRYIRHFDPARISPAPGPSYTRR
jgi:protein tyrosine/serine phosphatase